MSWRGVQLGLLILTIGLGGVGGVSYLHPFHVTVWDGYDTKLLLTVADGNIRVVRLVGHFVASYTAETPLDEFVGQWSKWPTKGLAWDTETSWLDVEDGTTVDALVVSCTFIAPLVLSVGLAFLIRVLRKHPWRIRILVRELIWPSDCAKSRVVGRVTRRLLVTILCLGGATAATLWVVSYKSTATGYARPSFWHGLDTGVRFLPAFPESPGLGRRPRLYSLRVKDGLVSARYFTSRRTGTKVNREFEVAGIRWAREIRPWRVHYGPGITEEDIKALRGTEVVSMRLELPLGYPVFLFWAWPVVAFWRGPWRRSGRRAEGFCIRCGYNLTGLVEPRCPECGTPLLPDQVEALQGPRSLEHAAYVGPLVHTGGVKMVPAVPNPPWAPSDSKTVSWGYNNPALRPNTLV